MKRVRVAIGMTLNLGDYESVRPVIEVEDDVLEGESTRDAYSRIRAEVEEMFMDEARRQGALLVPAHKTAAVSKDSAKREENV